MDATTFIKYFRDKFPDYRDGKKDSKNAVIILVVNMYGVWRVIMNVERRKNSESVWGFPGGSMNPGEHPFPAALRELREETTIVFNRKYWDRTSEHKFTRNGTRFYINVYTGPVFKGSPNNKEVVFVEHPRTEAFICALETRENLVCGKYNLRLRECMFNTLR